MTRSRAYYLRNECHRPWFTSIGEFGPSWHQAALKEKRHKAYEDFISVAEDLCQRGVTSPERLGIQVRVLQRGPGCQCIRAVRYVVSLVRDQGRFEGRGAAYAYVQWSNLGGFAAESRWPCGRGANVTCIVLVMFHCCYCGGDSYMHHMCCTCSKILDVSLMVLNVLNCSGGREAATAGC